MDLFECRVSTMLVLQNYGYEQNQCEAMSSL